MRLGWKGCIRTGKSVFIFSIRGRRDSKPSGLVLSIVEMSWLKGTTVGNFPPCALCPSLSLVCLSPSWSMSSAKCPNCGMEFTNETSVLKHMNHRFSSCRSFFLDGNPLPAETLPHSRPTLSNPPPYSTIFPDAGCVYGHGDGFMGWFYGDTHAAEQVSNLYYPFQSKGEWELALFLSQSGLSMKCIDEFLSLSLVRQYLSDPLTRNLSILTLTTRSLNLAFRSIVPGHYVVILSCC